MSINCCSSCVCRQRRVTFISPEDVRGEEENGGGDGEWRRNEWEEMFFGWKERKRAMIESVICLLIHWGPSLGTVSICLHTHTHTTRTWKIAVKKIHKPRASQHLSLLYTPLFLSVIKGWFLFLTFCRQTHKSLVCFPLAAALTWKWNNTRKKTKNKHKIESRIVWFRISIAFKTIYYK